MQNSEKEEKPFEEKLERELYGFEPSPRRGLIKKIWGVQKKKPEKVKTWEEVLYDEEVPIFLRRSFRKIFFIVFIFFVISLLVFGYVFYYRSIYIRGVNLNILGVEEVEPLMDYEYLIKIENNSNYDLVDSKLIINLPEGIYFPDNVNLNQRVINVGDLQARSSRELKIPLFFFGNFNEIRVLKISFRYSTPKRHQEFQIDKELNVIIKKNPINLQVFTPNKVFTNEPFNIIIKGVNSTNKTYSLKVNLNIQGNYEILTASPPPNKNFEWIFLSLAPNSEFEIYLITKYLKSVVKPLNSLHFTINYLNKNFELQDYLFSINILESPVVLEIESKPSENVVNLGDQITYIIKWTNKSSIPLKNVKLKVNFEGPFDYETLRTDGYFDPYENSIIWNPRNKASLLNVNPGVSDSVSFTISSLRNYPAGKKNLELIVNAILETESIPPEVQILSKKLSIETQSVKRIIGKLTASRILLYQDPEVKNTGPFPLQNGKPTTLSFYLKLNTYGEDFQNLIIKTKIPVGVKLTGLFGGLFNVNNLQFNIETGEFTYRIDEIQAGYGDIYPSYTLMFQIEVTPPLFGDINQFVILPFLEISGQGKFSLQNFNLKFSELTPRLIGFESKY